MKAFLATNAAAIADSNVRQLELNHRLIWYASLIGACLLVLFWVQWKRLVLDPVAHLLSGLKVVGQGDLSGERTGYFAGLKSGPQLSLPFKH